MRNRLGILVAVVAVVAGLWACGSGGSRQARVSPTPTKTAKPTFTATFTPTLTPVPTDTPLPTDTPTPEPPTNTPIILTATDTPAPTETPTLPPTATPTKKPTSKPKPTSTKTSTPRPTNTPAPAFEFRAIHQTNLDTPNCGSTGIKGTTYTRGNAGMPGICVAVWADGWEGTVSNPSSSTGAWDVLLNNVPVAGTWHVRAVNPSTCQPKSGGGGYTAQCTGWRSEDMVVTTTSNCNGSGAVQWVVVDFKQN